MPIELHRIGDCTISSEKRDEVLPRWGGMSIITAFLFIFLAIIFIGTGIVFEDGSQVLIGVGTLMIAFALLMLPSTKQGCGVAITLSKPGWVDDETTYKFSTDPDQDAKEIKAIIDRKVKEATAFVEEKQGAERARVEKENQCCTQYRSVMEKVKPQ